MDDSVAMGMAGFGLFAMLFGFLLAILWILVPFAIFGIKPLLRQVIGQLVAIQRQNNDLLATLQAQQRVPPASTAADRLPPAAP